MREKKLVLFGAGKIGRSFIAQLFCRSGYETVFVDINKDIINEINSRKRYHVIVKGERDEAIEVYPVRGILLSDEEQIIREILTADLLAVSVGQSGLPATLPVIARALVACYNQDPDRKTDIIIAENLRNAAEYFLEELPVYLPPRFPLRDLVGLVETSIGKMVPLIPEKVAQKDILLVYAEPYNTLILDGKAFRNPKPEVEGIAFKDNMKAWVDRKSFIHNLGHAALAYLGYLYDPGLHYTWEALENKRLRNDVRNTMLEAAAALAKKYPEEFTFERLEEHTDELLHRFANRHLGDTIFRVGCDLYRKLGPADRLAGAIRLAMDVSMPYDKILYTLVAGIYFRALDEKGEMLPSDKEFQKHYRNQVDAVLREVCGFEEEIFPELFQKARVYNRQILGLE